MRTFSVRNRLTGMVIAEVAVDHVEQIMAEVIAQTGSAIEDIAASLGKTMAEVREALDIVEIPQRDGLSIKAGRGKTCGALPRRPLYADEVA